MNTSVETIAYKSTVGFFSISYLVEESRISAAHDLFVIY